MTSTVVVREYAYLTTAPIAANTLDRAHISESAFRWLVELGQQFRRNGLPLFELDSQKLLRLDNYVGVLESPCGTVIEVLPKHTTEQISAPEARALLKRLIKASMQLSVREADFADVERFEMPIREWLITCFLNELEVLLKRGLQFDYQVREEEARFLRGQLDIAKQLRQPPGKAHVFNIRHDLFLPDRPENRLIKSALVAVCSATQDNDNWRLAHEMLSQLLQLPESSDPKADFKAWSTDRLLTHYRPIKPWCEFILNQHVPLSVSGGWRGISMLFPMEKLFENYVAEQLRRAIGRKGTVRTQLATEYLCEHRGKGVFKLRPDIEVVIGDKRWIMDTKWKLLDVYNGGATYGLSERDFYQMLAYSYKYLELKGNLALIYPAWSKFPREATTETFKFDQDLNVSVLAFDLMEENESLNLCAR
ncbi:restriction endonuclease [Idiomarina sp. WRN-38]|uniref:McrC family protein n=1 Tax=Idiomarina sp. OXR-189 TaxID=3100175 RepID=UPI000733879E|nr:McrC family protein [Idiomarina sp. OXR-189]KTG23491.1 restriction endonuclease [Idiomarina sp. H105]MCH2454588.1 McrC family protein [Idiomarina sp.]OAE90883.1 restriction endonuclease [Idiomarina sp. WRN-38]WPZ00385.1 McrC family protein [Idiomarina sp. OXR-189]